MKIMVTITKEEYDKLVWDSEFLGALESHGVDNWEGYSEAYTSVVDED